MMVENTILDGVKIFTPKKIDDERGFFSELYNAARWAEHGFITSFVQDNQSLSKDSGVIRGLHFQTAPFAQDKLVRVVRGRIVDVAVDIRRTSPTFGKHVAVELSEENWRQLLVPIGFAHGFCTLEPNTQVMYKVTNYYSAVNDFGLAFDDPELGINWPVASDKAVVSDKDRRWPKLSNLINTFP